MPLYFFEREAYACTPLFFIFVFDVIEFKFTYFFKGEAHASPFMFNLGYALIFL